MDPMSPMDPSLHSGCLHTTNAQHTVACRKGAVRLYGVLAGLHPGPLHSHLPRVADSIAARVKDKDGGESYSQG